MRNRVLNLAIVGLVAAASGCAAMRADPHRPSTFRSQLDQEVIDYVETTAARSGTRVHWVNPPTKK